MLDTLHLDGLRIRDKRNAALGAPQQIGGASEGQRQHRGHLWHLSANVCPACIHSMK